MSIVAPDLTKQPPRNPRARLGGYAILPRLLDKGRAALAGKLGEYDYDCPTDRLFLDFAGIDPGELKEQLATGKGDGGMLEWIRANAEYQRTPAEIAAWSAFVEQRAPANPDSRAWFQSEHQRLAPERDDISTFFELLELDDYATFGGQP
jgi:hypothetical protein